MTHYYESKIKQARFVYLFKETIKKFLIRMKLNNNRWKSLFLFCAGIFVGTAFCMKWMEADLWANGEKFTIPGLELFYTKEKMYNIFSGLDTHVRTILRYHLYFDFAFMAGVYPGITSLCMMARQKSASLLRKRLLTILAWFQLLAWSGDVVENYYLLSWIEEPVIGHEFRLYHFIVGSKWVIALSGVLLSIPLILLRKRNKSF